MLTTRRWLGALHAFVGDVILALGSALLLSLWPLTPSTVVSLAVAALFLSYACLSPTVRMRFVR